VVERNGEKREVYYFWLGLEVNERPAVHVLVILDTPINIVRRMVVIMRKVQEKAAAGLRASLFRGERWLDKHRTGAK
jgi:hypothetical protein